MERLKYILRFLMVQETLLYILEKFIYFSVAIIIAVSVYLFLSKHIG